MKPSLHTILTKAYRIFIRDTLLALSRLDRSRKRKLILDMDWYRYSFSEEEAQRYLYRHPEITGRADIIRISREQVIGGSPPALYITGKNYRSFAYKGFRLWGLCKATICSHIGALAVDVGNSEHMATVSSIYGEAAQALDKLPQLFKRLKPDTVLVFQGGFHDSRCVVEVGRQFSINVVGVENAMMGGLMILDNLSGQIINRHALARTGAEWLEAREVSAEACEATYGMWKDALKQKAKEHRTGGIDTEDDVRKELALTGDQRIVLFLGQVLTDASISMDSHYYQTPLDCMEHVAKIVDEQKDTVLVIRLHPKELSGQSTNEKSYNRATYRALEERGLTRQKHIRIVEDTAISTYTLMEMARVGVTMTSQAGFEMCLYGKPVIICGSAFYSAKGFTLDLAHPCALEALLREALYAPPNGERIRTLALEFLHHFYHHSLFNRTFSNNDTRLRQLLLREATWS